MSKAAKAILFFLLALGLSYVGWSNLRKVREVGEPTMGHRDLPTGVNALFGASGKCGGCHGFDPQQLTSVDANLNDVNITDDWIPTMMANSAKDPFWQAKVSHEVLVNPSHQISLEDKCTSCHAPLGHFNAKHIGQPNYTFAEMISDSIAMDGVSCVACHQLDSNYLATGFSGNLVYDTNGVVFGPYPNPFFAPMLSFAGYDVKYAPWVDRAEACADCHTLITNTVDLAGVPTGGEFVEQATYHEWVNSQYAVGATARNCQSCHMSKINDTVALALDYSFVGGESPFWKHILAGGNVFMLQLMKDNIDSLGIQATAENYDSTIAATNSMLKDSSVTVNILETNRTNDTVFYDVSVENLTGHKLPSGYPSRRMFVQFVVLDDVGDTLFKSGLWDNTYEVVGHDPTWEPHYNMINDENQVQIYEMVMGDVNGDKTTVLERADVPLKDNRVPPKGFSVLHASYDTTVIAGMALSDTDFNLVGPSEGSGVDVVHYHVPLAGYTGDLNVIARLYYQAAPPGWMVEMFSYSSPEIDKFKGMYDAADQTPILMQQDMLGDLFVGIKPNKLPDPVIYPNPTSGQLFLNNIDLAALQSIELYTISGRLVDRYAPKAEISIRGNSGVYLLSLSYKNGRRVVRKVIKR